jgi:hypothetical protein
MPNKYYYLGDCKAVMPDKYDLGLTMFPDDYLASLPTLEVDPTFAATLAVGWFEGKERYEMLVDTKWEDCLGTSYESYKKHWPDLYRTIIVQPPPVGGEQDIEKHIGQTIYEINQRNSKVIGYLSTTPPQPSTPPPGENKPFIVANVREIFDNEETSYSRKVELLNEVAAKFYQPRTDSEAVDFQDWIDLHGYYHTTSNDKAWFREDGEGVAGTTAELFSIFLTNKTKQL